MCKYCSEEFLLKLKIIVWHFALISPVYWSPFSILFFYCAPNCRHSANALVRVSRGVNVLTLLLSRKSLCYLVFLFAHIQYKTRGRTETHKAKPCLIVSRCHHSSSDRFSASQLPWVNSSSTIFLSRAARASHRSAASHVCMCRKKSARATVRRVMIMQQIRIIYWGSSSVLCISVTLGRSDSEWWRGPTPPFLALSHSIHTKSLVVAVVEEGRWGGCHVLQRYLIKFTPKLIYFQPALPAHLCIFM